MPTNQHLKHGLAALLAAVLASCGGSDSSTQADTYAGVIDGSALDTKLLPTAADKSPSTHVCPGGACYPAQTGYAKGNIISFYNLGAISGFGTSPSPVPSPLPVSVADHQSKGGGGQHADNFPNGCAPGPAFNRQADAYPTAQQAPIFDSLPLATSAFGAIVYPIVALYGVQGIAGAQCNDLKDSRSISSDPTNPGHFGAVRTASPVGYQVWGVVDPTATVNSLTQSPAARVTLNALGWYRGLQLQFIDGGPVKVLQQPDAKNPGQNISVLQTMDGVLLTSGSFPARTTDSKAVLLPNLPGDDAYSPIVRLHNYTAKPTDPAWKGVCPTGQSCPPNYLPIGAPGVAATAANVLFIAAAQP